MPDGTTVGTYSQADFEEECFEQFGEGRDPEPCPVCERVGFYAPRIVDPDGRFRQCRFCGFTQHVEGPALTYVPIRHDCSDWPECARAPYLWWIPPEQETFRCAYCGESVSVADAIVPRPVDDKDHPWWRVPQGKKRFYYRRFWENWEVTKGRVHL
jgi:hypothetical protein